MLQKKIRLVYLLVVCVCVWGGGCSAAKLRSDVNVLLE